MVKTASTMLPLGTSAPDFRLLNIDGKTISLSEIATGKGLVVMFICNHCPFVKHVAPELVRLTKDYESRGIHFVAISSNDPDAYPDDAPAKMAAEACEAVWLRYGDAVHRSTVAFPDGRGATWGVFRRR